MPGVLHLAFLRSPYAHARITGFDVTEATRAPGVVRVLSGAEISALVPSLPVLWPCGDPKTRTRPLVAAEVVRYVGEPVAAVMATSRYLAEDALDLIEVEYEPLPAVASVEQASSPERRCCSPSGARTLSARSRWARLLPWRAPWWYASGLRCRGWPARRWKCAARWRSTTPHRAR